ncbi:peptidase M23 [Microtetraspora sp. NBRC 13810]|uniref:M23 family metallopeptidase n=1 Tax=Microtetraspora sp. NBRC 13810 TaxID=3030990 RepID=UPI0024A04C7E|nr:M23 family metallopeptidase [Microtetraspora sp. NBRC 13810]GLW05024.1 peptidase M23 [Microtetraspora sp. NBRC 13810]
MRIVTVVAIGASLFALGLPVHPAAASTAAAAPTFQLPFPCGQTWAGSSGSSAHASKYEIDFNQGSGDADLGAPVVAAAAGKVITSANQGSLNGFGNLVKIQHSGGLVTFYAHLNSRSVSVGATVKQGQQIGTVGKTTSKHKGMVAHLHYEVRTTGGSYPGNIRAASFNGAGFKYPSQTLKSQNCGGGAAPAKPAKPAEPSPGGYTPEKVCGSGYKKVDSAAVGSAATAYLLYNASSGSNCVVTMKKTSVGTKTAVTAYLEVKGKARATDSGSYAYYAGPVRAPAKQTCVKWGGSAGSARYDAPAFEHCG